MSPLAHAAPQPTCKEHIRQTRALYNNLHLVARLLQYCILLNCAMAEGHQTLEANTCDLNLPAALGLMLPSHILSRTLVVAQCSQLFASTATQPQVDGKANSYGCRNTRVAIK